MSGANDRTGVGAGSAEWGTPDDLYGQLNDAFSFTYDAFSSHANHKASLYSTMEGTFRCLNETRAHGAPHAECSRHLNYEKVSDQDGYQYPWDGERVFMNPPYSRGLIDRAAAKANASRRVTSLIVALLASATDTDWFRDHVAYPAAHVDHTKRVKFIHPPDRCGRKCSMGMTPTKKMLHPHRPGEPTPGSPGGHCVAIYRREWTV